MVEWSTFFSLEGKTLGYYFVSVTYQTHGFEIWKLNFSLFHRSQGDECWIAFLIEISPHKNSLLPTSSSLLSLPNMIYTTTLGTHPGLWLYRPPFAKPTFWPPPPKAFPDNLPENLMCEGDEDYHRAPSWGFEEGRENRLGGFGEWIYSKNLKILASSPKIQCMALCRILLSL